MCSLFPPCGSMESKLGSSEASRQESLPHRCALLVPRGGAIAPENPLHGEVQEGAPNLPSVL